MSKPAFPPTAASKLTVLLLLLCAVLGGVAWAQKDDSEGLPQAGNLETDTFRASVSTVNGGLTSFVLKDARYQKDGEPLDMVTTDKAEFLPMSFSLEGLSAKGEGFKVLDASGTAVRLMKESDGLRIVRKYEPGKGPYELWVTTRVTNLGKASRAVALTERTFHYAPRSDEASPVPFLPVRSPWMSQGVCFYDEDELEREDGKSLAEEPESFSNVGFAGAENVYFLNAVVPHDEAAQRCELKASNRGRDEAGDPLGTLFETSVIRAPRDVGPGESTMFTTLAYLGPKTHETLSVAGHHLDAAIDGGWFSSLSRLLTDLLSLIHGLLGNWGLAIIVLTLVVKTILYPLTAKQMQSMARMKELKPEMDRINELYADDREKKGAATMELYREKGVNPMAGCFPMLVQLPIWFSLYASLSTNIELLHAPFVGWLSDLSSPDPYFILPLSLGALMFLQQKMTPASGMDPAQQKLMMYMMPSMMVAFMLFLPAGLCLYMFTNSALSIGQQRLIESQIAKSSQSGESDSPSSSPTFTSDTDTTSGETSRRPRVSRPTKAERRSRRGK